MFSVFYHFIIADLEFSTRVTHIMSIVVFVFLSIGHAISRQVNQYKSKYKYCLMSKITKLHDRYYTSENF